MDELDDEIDLDKTKENLWSLITFNTQTNFESIFHFLDDSIPKLKRKQQKDMLEALWNRLFSVNQRICKLFIKSTFQEIDGFF